MGPGDQRAAPNQPEPAASPPGVWLPPTGGPMPLAAAERKPVWLPVLFLAVSFLVATVLGVAVVAFGEGPRSAPLPLLMLSFGRYAFVVVPIVWLCRARKQPPPSA